MVVHGDDSSSLEVVMTSIGCLREKSGSVYDSEATVQYRCVRLWVDVGS